MHLDRAAGGPAGAGSLLLILAKICGATVSFEWYTPDRSPPCSRELSGQLLVFLP